MIFDDGEETTSLFMLDGYLICILEYKVDAVHKLIISELKSGFHFVPTSSENCTKRSRSSQLLTTHAHSELNDRDLAAPFDRHLLHAKKLKFRLLLVANVKGAKVKEEENSVRVPR